ncbi:hypothetical protein L7F22_038549 [Adiantum nelumboides]|nr:hypothetical protein [Adiantum nelumboides]
MLFLHILLSCRLTCIRQALQHVFLLFWLLSCLGLSSCTHAKSNPSSMAHRRFFLQSDAIQTQGPDSQLRLKLERISGLHTDRYEAFRNAIQRDHARRALLERRRFLPETNSTALPQASLNVISGSSVGSGAYFATVSAGTPPQKLFLIADTGSDLMWVKCRSSQQPVVASAKTDEIPMNQSFDESASSTFSPISCLSKDCAAWFSPPACEVGLSRNCKISYSYTDKSSITGSIAFETITLGEDKHTNMVLGCGQQYVGPNFEKSGGVVGLGQGPLSLASQLAARSAYSNKFSYCLADFLGPSSISGSLAFGETDLLQTALTYTSLIQNPFAESFYYVKIHEVRVGGVALDIPAYVWKIDARGSRGTIVDSGTTLAQFAKPAYDAIRNAFQETIHGISQLDEEPVPGLSLCYRTNTTNATASTSFPNFTIVFDGGLVFEPPTENYFTEVAPGITCLAMQEVPAGSFSVVGSLLQQNYHMEFDRLHNRLGVSPADCSKLHS